MFIVIKNTDGAENMFVLEVTIPKTLMFKDNFGIHSLCHDLTLLLFLPKSQTNRYVIFILAINSSITNVNLDHNKLFINCHYSLTLIKSNNLKIRCKQ